MTRQEIISVLQEKGYSQDASATQQDLYTQIRRNQLFSQSNRLNAGWARGKYIIASYEDDNIPLNQFLEQWRDKVERYQNQYLCLEVSPNQWHFYDYSGNEVEFLVEPPQIQSHRKAKSIVLYKRDESNINHLQQIFYGAPGTGKSHRIKNDERVKTANEKNLVFRTTFHPDSDYSTFVGAYKPTIAQKAVRNVAGDIVKSTEKKDVYEDCITYSFVPQAFLQAYVAAWNNLDENVFLVIEEINRGNCAQIFGDLFQLLDRDDEGYSEYPIKADIDLVRYLEDGKDEAGQDILINKDGIKDGKLRLPKNLYIWATMNTSDQSLFPIDSAFKRRWEWVYQPIDTAKETWYVKVGESYYSWTSFLNKVNDELLTDETAEDKHLGFYFCKATGRRLGTETTPNVITAETFVGKVLFYLWNDVFKVYGIPSSIGSSKDWPYRRFYLTSGEVDTEKVSMLMTQLKIDADAAEVSLKTEV